MVDMAVAWEMLMVRGCWISSWSTIWSLFQKWSNQLITYSSGRTNIQNDYVLLQKKNPFTIIEWCRGYNLWEFRFAIPTVSLWFSCWHLSYTSPRWPRHPNVPSRLRHIQIHNILSLTFSENRSQESSSQYANIGSDDGLVQQADTDWRCIYQWFSGRLWYLHCNRHSSTLWQRTIIRWNRT